MADTSTFGSQPFRAVRAQRLKKFNLAWKISISLEMFNPAWKLQSWPSEFPTENGGLVGDSLEIFNRAWKFQSRRTILNFFQALGPEGGRVQRSVPWTCPSAPQTFCPIYVQQVLNVGAKTREPEIRRKAAGKRHCPATQLFNVALQFFACRSEACGKNLGRAIHGPMPV